MPSSLPRALAACLLVPLFACGGPPPSPAATAPPAASVAPSSLASAAAPASASATPSASAPPESASAVPAAPPPATTAAIVMDDPSGCTPVATAFEHETHPKIRACYREGKKEDPNLEGAVKILLTFDARGKRTVKTEDITLPKAVADCMTKVIQTTPFPEGKRCVGKSLTFPIKFPSR